MYMYVGIKEAVHVTDSLKLKPVNEISELQ